MSIFTYLAVALVIFAAGLASGIRVNEGEHARDELVRQQTLAKGVAAKTRQYDQAGDRLQARVAATETKYLTVTQEIERVVEKPVYSNVCIDDDGLRILNAAIAPGRGSSAPAPASAVPASAASR